MPVSGDLVCSECGGVIVAGQTHVCTVRIPRPSGRGDSVSAHVDAIEARALTFPAGRYEAFAASLRIGWSARANGQA